VSVNAAVFTGLAARRNLVEAAFSSRDVFQALRVLEKVRTVPEQRFVAITRYVIHGVPADVAGIQVVKSVELLIDTQFLID
jgi:hypothetical protein